MRQEEGQRHDIVMIQTPRSVTHKWEDYHKCRGPPQGVRGPSPTSGSPAQGCCTRKTRPQKVSLENQRDYIQESQRAAGNKVHS